MKREDSKKRRVASNPDVQNKRDELAKKIKARLKAQQKDAKTAPITEEERKKRLEAYKQRLASRKAEDEEKKAEEEKKKEAEKKKAEASRKPADRLSATRAALAALRAKKIKANEVDENGIPAVGDAPKDPNAELAAVPKPGEKGNPPADAPAPAEESAKAPEKTDAEESATVLVQVNEKLDEINKRAEVDKVVKTELEQIKETLTGVAASLKGVKAGKADVLTKQESAVIVDFLSKIDAAFKKDVVGFEATASLKDREAFDKLVSASRVSIDIASEKAHNAIIAYSEKKATGTDVKNAVKEVKAAFEKFQTIKSVTAVFKKEASVASNETNHIKRVVAYVQEMVVAGKVEANQIAGLVNEYLGLSPIEFKSVVATVSKVAGKGIYPENIHVEQSGSGNRIDSLEAIFDR